MKPRRSYLPRIPNLVTIRTSCKPGSVPRIALMQDRGEWRVTSVVVRDSAASGSATGLVHRTQILGGLINEYQNARLNG
jgi:hypothetical protein